MLDVFEGMRRKAAFAAMVVVVTSAVHELLLTEVPELTIFLYIVGLKTAHGREGPAAPAFTLVFDRGDNSLGPPVPVIRNIF